MLTRRRAHQLLQERVPAAELGVVLGVQSAVCAAFEMLSFAAGLVLHRPQQFPALMLGSCCAVATAVLLLARFALSQRAATPREGAPHADVEARELLAPEPAAPAS